MGGRGREGVVVAASILSRNIAIRYRKSKHRSGRTKFRIRALSDIKKAYKRAEKVGSFLGMGEGGGEGGARGRGEGGGRRGCKV